MNFTVVNCGLNVSFIKVTAVASSSVFLIGDTENIALSSVFDTPPEALIIGPFVPIAVQR
ncbi:spore gernimation protein GerPD [Metabacillus sp. GX 13764]|uniref:spore gernimation protein GerPD n=1 Tax=Metabacillus kandeliae TaxID=2900151 RepID=UPI001E4B95ED|nr:spore gernimation protein GerPD [Metabacillus kandeliae]MCD7034898.1 spore gernimation protein GerPD [Metabacillus kandeliae]